MRERRAAYMPLCHKCGRHAEYLDVESGRWLCAKCIASIVEYKFLRGIRLAKPRRGDNLVMVCRGDLQSYYALKTLIKVEKAYEVTIEAIELAPQPLCEELCEEEGIKYCFEEAKHDTYTDFRLAVLARLRGARDPLLVMPDALEDLAVYAMSEVWLGDLRGLLLDMLFRVSYPLSGVSVKALALLEPRLAARLPPAYLLASSRELLEELSRSTPSLPYSAVEALFELTAKLRKKSIKTS